MSHVTDFIFPDFTNSLVNVPHSILAHFDLPHDKPALSTPLLTDIKDCSKVVLFLVDGFGYNLFKNEATKFPLFNNIETSGLSEKISTIFPSTTAAAVTTIQSGLSPREHGLFKWHMYFREVDGIVEPLPYNTVITEYSETPKPLPSDSSMIFNAKTIYETLGEGKVKSFYFLPQKLVDSTYTRAVSKGATLMPYLTIVDLLASLRKILQETEGKAFCYVYWGAIDAMQHTYGPASEPAKREVALLDEMLRREFLEKLDEKTLRDTALMLTADHGLSAIYPEQAVYLNDYPEVTKNFRKSESGFPIPPTENPRDVFLDIEDDKVDETITFLTDTFGDIADFIKLDDLMISKLFGDSPEHPEFYNRLGNVLILPKGEKTIWYRYMPGNVIHEHGHHGGLTEDEMKIPFIAARLSELKLI